MRHLAIALLAATATIAVASTAHAVPLVGSLVANGDVHAVFAYKDAGNTSQLFKVNVGDVIFNNQTDAAGKTVDLGVNSGLIEFMLSNVTQGYSFVNDVADSVDGFYHAHYGTTAADFGVTFTDAANSAIASLTGPVILVGFEDKRFGDYDYNDLIFAFSAVQDVPEPASLALLGMGMLGLGLARRRRAV